MSQSLKGKRYINLLRASTKLNEASTVDQKRVNDEFASKCGMIHVRDVVLEGVSGSVTFNRRDLTQLVADARSLKNFDVLLVHDFSRLTRGGPNHGAAVRRDFSRAGVIVVSVLDTVPEGDEGDIVVTILDYKNKMFAKTHAATVTRGIYSNVERGDCERHGEVTYGVDRLYLRSDGEPFILLRYMPYGVRLLMTPDTKSVIRTLDPKIDHHTAYRKQRGEKVRLILGLPERVERVREIFSLRYRHNWGFSRITRHLNTTPGALPKRAALWQQCNVRDIALNPMYLGWSYQFKMATGTHVIADKGQPRKTPIDQTLYEGTSRLSIPHQRRHVSDMLRVDHPTLKDFITDTFVRKRAEEVIKQYFDTFHLIKRKIKATNHNPHPYSNFILRDVIHESYYDKKMRGQATGNHSQYRYYVPDPKASSASPLPKPTYKMVPAEPLELSVLALLRRVFENITELSSMIQMYVEAKLKQNDRAVSSEELAKEERQVAGKLNYMYESLSEDELREQVELIKRLKDRRVYLQREMSKAPLDSLGRNVAELTAFVLEKLKAFDDHMAGPVNESLRALVNSLCRNITVNLNTLETTVEIALPEYLLSVSNGEFDPMCMAYTQDHLSTRHAHSLPAVIVAYARLQPVSPQTNSWQKDKWKLQYRVDEFRKGGAIPASNSNRAA